MSDSPAEREMIEKAWKLLNIQANTMLKLAQTRTELWKLAVAGMAAGGALVAGTAAVIKMFAP